MSGAPWIATGVGVLFLGMLYGYGVIGLVQLAGIVLWITWAVLFSIAEEVR